MRRGVKLGQHFLTAPGIARAVGAAAGVGPGVTVLEIGPGRGILTHELLELGGTVIAVEKDPALVEHLKERFHEALDLGVLTIVEGDIRDVPPESLGLKDHSYVLAANIPYYITGDIIRTFLESKVQPQQMALLVQKEVAERIARNKKESILSLSVKTYGTPKYIKTVSRGSFSPAPKVDSAILAIENISRDFFSNISEARFFEVVKAGFASKRKMLAGNLKKIASTEHIEKAFRACDLKPNVRAEDVSLKEWGCLVEELSV